MQLSSVCHVLSQLVVSSWLSRVSSHVFCLSSRTFHLFVMVLTLELSEDVGQVTGIETDLIFGESLRVVNPGGKHLGQIRDESRHRRREWSVQIPVEENLGKKPL